MRKNELVKKGVTKYKFKHHDRKSNTWFMDKLRHTRKRGKEKELEKLPESSKTEGID